MTSSIYLYGLVHADAGNRALAAASSVEGPRDLGPVYAHTVGSVMALLGNAKSQEIEPARRNLLGHARILEATMKDATIIPFSFGHIFPNINSVSSVIERHQEKILSEIHKFEGFYEFGIRVRSERDPALAAIVSADPTLAAQVHRANSAGDGGYYQKIAVGREIAERLDLQRCRAQKILETAIEPFVEAIVVRKPESETELLKCEVLIRHGEESAVEDALEAAKLEISFAPSVCTIRMIGPAPPFNFLDMQLRCDDLRNSS